MMLLSLALYCALLRLQLAQDLDCIVCPSGFYREGCSNDCAGSSGSYSGSSKGIGSDIGSGGDRGSGSGSGGTIDLGCFPCHSSCQECFGPQNTQCYVCTNLSLLLQEPTASDGGNASTCDNFLSVDASRPVLQCVEECPQGSSMVADNQRCVCQLGRYQNGTNCFDCSSNCAECVNGTEAGCLTCMSYSYENMCVEKCPSQTSANDNGQCLPVNNPFPIAVDFIILAIISTAIVIILVSFVITLFCCLGFYWKKKKRSKTEVLSTRRHPFTVAGSFRRVTVDFRSHIKIGRGRDNFQAIEGSNSEFLQPLSPALDPYNATNALTDFEEQETSMREAPDQETELRERADTVYVEMNPSCSTSSNSLREADAEPGPPIPVRTTSDKRQSGLLSSQSTNFEQEEYVNPKEMANSPYYVNQAAIDEHLSETEQPVAYEVPREGNEDDTEQELYEDMSGGLEKSSPTIPPRGVLCAEPEAEANDSSPQRHDTMDNQYVVMTPPRKESLSSNHLERHSYVNVPSAQDGLLQSVSSPTTKILAQDESQPIYYNVVRNGSGATKP